MRQASNGRLQHRTRQQETRPRPKGLERRAANIIANGWQRNTQRRRIEGHGQTQGHERRKGQEELAAGLEDGLAVLVDPGDLVREHQRRLRVVVDAGRRHGCLLALLMLFAMRGWWMFDKREQG